MRIRDLVLLVRLLVADRKRLALENVALRHQLTVLKRSVKRPRIEDSDHGITSSVARALFNALLERGIPPGFDSRIALRFATHTA